MTKHPPEGVGGKVLTPVNLEISKDWKLNGEESPEISSASNWIKLWNSSLGFKLTSSYIPVLFHT